MTWSMPVHTPRPVQTKILNECCEALDSGYTNIMINAGTGIGKSAIGMTLARNYDSAYILTRTTQLQNQYSRIYSKYLREIKGRRHYDCMFQSKTTCDNGACQYDDTFKKCPHCPYNKAKELAMHYPIVSTNYHYLYYTLNQFGKRDVCIFDEAHKLETTLLELTSESISQNIINRDLLLEVPNYNNPEDYLEYLEVWKEGYDELKKDTDIPKDRDAYNNKVWKYGWLLDNINDNDWVVQSSIHEDQITNITFKPLYPAQYDKRLINAGNTKIFLTATIGNFSEWCRYNNLDEGEVYYIHEKSPFPVENRPIIKNYVGKVDFEFWKNKQKVKLLCNIVRGLIDKYPDEKGVVHCTSHYQANLLKNTSSRCITAPNDNSVPRDVFIKDFIDSDEPLVFVSPSIKDGVDLRDDACRFQIVTNIPNPNMGDAQIKKRVKVNNDWGWYWYQTCMDLQQAYGRGVRHEDDYCDFYILDNRFATLLQRNGDLFDDYFLEAIVSKNSNHKHVVNNGGIV